MKSAGTGCGASSAANARVQARSRIHVPRKEMDAVLSFLRGVISRALIHAAGCV